MNYEDALLMLDMVDSGIIMLDKHQKIVFWNQFISDASKIDFSTVKGKHWLDIFPSLHETRVEKSVEKCLHMGFPSILSYKLIKTYFPLYKKSLATKPPYLLKQSIVIKPINHNGQNDGCIIYINDVSAAAKREQDLNRQTLELKHTMDQYAMVKSQFEDVFNNAHNGIVVFDEYGNITNSNEEANKLFNDFSENIIGENIGNILPLVNEKYFSDEKQCYWFGDNRTFNFEQHIEINNKHLLGSISQIEDNCEDSSFFVFITDITDKKVAESELRTANNELEAFAYRTSHDLRSPLVSSIKLLNVAQDKIKSGDIDSASTCLTHIDNSLRKLEVLIKDILKLTEIKNRQEDIQEIDLLKTIEESKSQIISLDNEEKIKYQIDFQHNVPVFTEKHRLQMILDNLLSNSIKYRDPKEPETHISIKTFESDTQILIDISDNGLGIPTEQHDNIFQMFHRFHPKTAFGSGLGLYMIKKGAESLGGDITFIPQEKGCCFRLSLPQKSHSLH